MIIFTKYSNDRRPELQIRTDIVEEGGVRSVVKAAADPRADGHISGLSDSFAGLRQIFAETRFQPNRCEAGDGFCSFEYLRGETLEEQMDTLLDSPDELVAALRDYFDELRSAADITFVRTDGFDEIFGDTVSEAGQAAGCAFPCGQGESMGEAQQESGRAFSVSNIDMVLNNIIVHDGWNIVDYEWTFRFPVPVNYIIWRAYHYYVDVNMSRQFLKSYDILSSYGITEEDIAGYVRMEENFQKYVTGDKVPLRDLYPDISPGYVVIGELLQAYKKLNEKQMVLIFPETDGIYVTDNMISTFTDAQGNYRRTVRTGGASRVRIDPTESAVIVHVNSMTANVCAGGHDAAGRTGDSDGHSSCPETESVELDLTKAKTNGILLGDNDFLFINEDPWVILTDLSDGTESITIDMRLMPLDRSFAAAWQKLGCRINDTEAEKELLSKKAAGQEKRMAFMRRSAAMSSNIIADRNRNIRELGDTRFMRVYNRIRAGRKQDDPLARFRPLLANESEGERILYSIDNVTYHDRFLLIRGWAVDMLFDCEMITVADASGNDVPSSILRAFRSDVAGQIDIDDSRRPGFEIRIRYSRLVNLPLTLRIEDPRGYIEVPVEDLDQDMIRRGRDGEIVFTASDAFPMDYDDYAGHLRVPRETLKKQRKKQFPYQPVVSFCIPAYNVSDRNLAKMTDSLLAQSYRGVEICIADGSSGDELERFVGERYGSESRVVYRKMPANPMIADNLRAAMEMASGDVIVPADANDIADPQTVYEIVKAFNRKDADAVYTDEDSVIPDGSCFTAPKFKPDYSPDYLRSTNYIGSFFAVRRSLLEEAGWPDPEYGEACIYDFILRCCEKARMVAHVPMALCHRRMNPLAELENPDGAKLRAAREMRAVEAHMRRTGIVGECVKTEIEGGYRVKARVSGRPLVSIIIPSRDHMDVLRRALDSIIGKTSYGNYEILIIENGSAEEETFRYYDRLRERYPFIRILEWNKPFNYSAINNFGVENADGEFLIFLNNDVEVITPGWIGEMLSVCQRDDCGACGAKLLFPNYLIQHVGVVIGMGGAAGHMYSGIPADDVKREARANLTQNLSAATAACLMVRRSVFEEIGGFDEELAVAFNDVDLCLKIRKAGYLIAVNPFAELFHYESLTRGSDTAPDDGGKHERFLKESGLIRSRWEKYFPEGDPYFNPNLDPSRGDLAFRGQYPARSSREPE